jgi:hypothetical protein
VSLPCAASILQGIEAGLPVLQQQCQQQQQQAAPLAAAADKPQRQQQSRAAAGGGSSGGGSSVCVYAVASSDTDDEGGSLEGGAGDATPAAAGAGGACVCVLDDDVQLHPLSLLQLVDELAAHPSLFMVTGYPLDIVATPPSTPRGSRSSASSSSSSSSSSTSGPGCFARLLSHAAASYHLPLAIGFSVADRGSFVWGGVMCMRAERLRQRSFGAAADAASDDGGAAAAAGVSQQPPTLLEVWADGGYSDDLLAAGFCGARGLPIGLPASALFPQLLPPSMGFSR